MWINKIRDLYEKSLFPPYELLFTTFYVRIDLRGLQEFYFSTYAFDKGL